MEQVARVVLALEANDVAEEVMHFLDRTGSARVVGTAADDRQLTEAVRQLEPDAVVAQLAGGAGGGPWTDGARPRHAGDGRIAPGRDQSRCERVLPLAR